MNEPTIAFGIEILEMGYTNDSYDLGIDPGAHYNYLENEAKEVVGLWRVGVSFPKVQKPIMKGDK